MGALAPAARAGKQGVGAAFDLDAMRTASARSWGALRAICERIGPGLRESDARRIARDVLRAHGAERLWHPVHVRFGANTLKTFRERSPSDAVLGADDIFFVDIGPVFGGHEGDVGTTFTTGDDAGMAACAAAAKTLFDDVRDVWARERIVGAALYDYATTRAAALGWRLNLGTKGHRVGDFPHAIHRGGTLSALHDAPLPGVWALEIQIAHPSEPYGAFHEDVLI